MVALYNNVLFFFSSRRRHTISYGDWSSDVCSSDLAAARMLGYQAAELIGKSRHELLHHTQPDGAPYLQEACPIYAALQDGAVRHVTEDVFWRKDGTSFPVEYISTPIREAGEIVGAVVTFKDITERKRAEEERAQFIRE